MESLKQSANALDWTQFCGTPNFTAWNTFEKDFTPCFTKLVLFFPTSLLLALVSGFYLGKETNWVIRSKPQLIVIGVRLFCTLNLTLLPIVALAVINYTGLSHVLMVDNLAAFMESSCWCFHLFYVAALRRRVSRSSRGPRPAILATVLILATYIISLRSAVLNYQKQPDSLAVFELVTASLRTGCLSLYFCTLIPHGGTTFSQFERTFEPLRTSPLPQEAQPYCRYNFDTDPYYLGVAREGAPFLSRLLLSWVRPLMLKGSLQKLRTPDDLFDLSPSLNTHSLRSRIQSHLSRQPPPNKPSLSKALWAHFGTRYMLLGILRFLADATSFAGPLLLNVLVQFIDDKTEPMLFGYICAAGFSVASFIGALCNIHFNFAVAQMGLRLRGALMTVVYDRALSATTARLSQFSVGEIVNFMSTDTERIVNFCPSFHAFWSLPFQVAVTLYLLYTQVGFAFLAGLGFAILLIPINRWIAIKIGQLSVALMKNKDERVRVMSEVLAGMRAIKLYAWEDHFRSKIADWRGKEMVALKGRKYLDALCVYFWATTPVLVAILTFGTYTLMGNTLTAAKVFTSVALFNMLISPLNAFPWVINGLVEAYISLQRLQKLFVVPINSWQDMYGLPKESDVLLEMTNATFVWKDTESIHNRKKRDEPDDVSLFQLQNINLTVRKGEFIGVVGQVGAGKSSLLHAIMGELHKTGGDLNFRDISEGVAYVAQEPWVQQGTIRENILFGKGYDAQQYKYVLEACALLSDLQQLPHGDQTLVGDNGVTLSGGQKARVALARAVYQDKALYVLDDVLSAVDAHVARHLVTQCLRGLLAGKTVILCTHHVRFLKDADRVILLEAGKITRQGSPVQVLSPLQEDLTASINSQAPVSTPLLDVSEPEQEKSSAEESEEFLFPAVALPEEEKCDGAVQFPVYAAYWKAIGIGLAPVILASVLFMQISKNTSDWWLAYWISDTHNSTHSNVTDSLLSNADILNHPSNVWHYGVHLFKKSLVRTEAAGDVRYYLTIYASLAVINTCCTFLRAFLFAYGGLEAARKVHEQLLKAVLKARMVFFDVTPLGRILNRFSSDLYTIDDSLPFMLNIFLAQTCGLFGTIIVMCFGIPWILLLFIPLGAIYLHLQYFYRHTSRELKRISSLTLSPFYSHLSESLTGKITIRAMRALPRFVLENVYCVEDSQKAQFASIAAAHWLSMRLQLIGVAMITGVGVVAVLQHQIHVVDPGLVGLAISYALSVTSLLGGVVTSFTETEKEMVAVERTELYIERIEPESDESCPVLPPANWPSQGVIEMENLGLQYREHLPLVLRGVSFITEPGEKIGIVGRTGSGKSSLFAALFRLCEPSTGQVRIDGINIRRLDLHTLRLKLAIIPQDPFLFSGTIRENLDPLNDHSDEELVRALGKCHLIPAVEKLGGLTAKIEDRGSGLSVGQKQLLCLARAILKNAKVLCIDEATAQVDAETDRLLQETIRCCFTNSTVLTIAHRVTTVLDAHRVLLMQHGQVVEFNSPTKLLQDPHSGFYKLVEQARA